MTTLAWRGRRLHYLVFIGVNDACILAAIMLK